MLHYRVLESLGAGGMGEVFRAEDLTLGRQVAIKVLLSSHQLAPERVARFEREARLLASLNHPNIATLHSLEESEGERLLVMELVEGETLAKRIKQGPLPLEEALSAFRQIVDALGAAHGKGVIHRDLKPSNIQVTGDGRVKLLDFGLAKAILPESEVGDASRTLTLAEEATRAGALMGTVPYMSPEQARGQAVDARTDIWAFGCCLLEALGGRPPFAGETAADVLAHILAREPDWSAVPPGTPASVLQLLRRCLRKDREERPQSIEEIEDWFAAELTDSPSSASALRSVAVLPFLTIGSDPENEVFADGMTEDVIAQLAKIGGLTVIARSSVMRFKDRESSLREIAERLGVGALLDGTVRRAGEQMRIVAQLVEAETERPLWSETYDRSLDDIFAIQSDVALHIATALEAKLSADLQSRIEKPPTDNLAAYRFYLEGRHCVFRYTDEGIRRGLELYGRAIRLDPEYALAHAGTARAYVMIGFGFGSGVLTPREAYAKAKQAAITALEIEPALGDAHAALGMIHLVSDYDWAAAEREVQRALELNPGAADSHAVLGLLLSSLERHDEAITAMQRAQELDPLAAVNSSDLATKYLRTSRYEEAIREARRVIDLEPEFPMAHSTLGWAYLKTGRQEEGLAELNRAVEVAPGNTMMLAQLGQAYAEVGRREDALDILDRLTERSETQYVSPYHLAYVHTGLGDHDHAVECLDRAFDEHASGIYGVKGSFLFTPLHSHSGFQALLGRMRLA